MSGKYICGSASGISCSARSNLREKNEISYMKCDAFVEEVAAKSVTEQPGHSNSFVASLRAVEETKVDMNIEESSQYYEEGP